LAIKAADLDFWESLARRDPDLRESTKVLLAEMAYHFRGRCHQMSQHYLAGLLHWSNPTVKRAVRQPVEHGWIVCERVEFGESNRYQPAFPGRYVA
jgi:hypothetical protein